MEKQLVTRIVRDSVLDGPGCRYVVFVKGCHLRCPWCHNPETQQTAQEIITYEKFCIQCGKCLDAAPSDVQRNALPVRVENSRAEQFFPCVSACPTEALEYAAREYTADELICDMLKYRTIYQKTKGGLTISGGEPLFTPSFSLSLLQKAAELGFHTALDTSGTFPWEHVALFLPVVKLWLYDIKHTDDETVLSSLALENLQRLAQEDAHIWIRVPIIPNYNDTPPIWEETARFIQKAGPSVEQVSLLPFHPFGSAKYTALHRHYPYSNQELDENVLKEAYRLFLKYLNPETVTLGRRMVHG